MIEHAGKALLDPHAIFERVGLQPGWRVADLGCGRTGHFVFPAAKAVGERGIVYAVDVVKEILTSIMSRAKTGGWSNVQTVWADIELSDQIPIPAGTLDACWLVNVLFLLTDKRAALGEAVRLLKRGGRLVVVEWARPLGTVGPSAAELVTLAKIEALLPGWPLSLVDNFPAGPYHYAVIAEKI